MGFRYISIVTFFLIKTGIKKKFCHLNTLWIACSGYISPEYAMGGIFSEKSDVYNFGILVLEIISSKKNTSFYLYDQQLGFLAYVSSHSKY
jgi:hypothetical protein